MTFKNSQDSDWCTEEHDINSSTKFPKVSLKNGYEVIELNDPTPYGVVELNDPIKEKINEEKEQLNQALKQQLVEYFSDCFTSTLPPEDIIDCLRSSCSSSLDYAKSEYEKYLFIAKQLGIE